MGKRCKAQVQEVKSTTRAFKVMLNLNKNGCGFIVIAFSIIILLQTGFLIYSFNEGNQYTKDSYEYLTAAKNIIEGYGWYVGDVSEVYKPHLVSRRPPLYPLIISLCMALYGNTHLVLLLQNILSMLNIASLFILIIKFNFRYKWALLLPLLLIFFPSQFIFSNMYMAEIVFQTLILWSFVSMVFFLKDPKFFLLILHVIFISLAILTKPVLFLFWIAEILFFVFLFYRKNIQFPQLFFSLIPALAVTLISLYNLDKTGHYHYSSIKTTNIFGYNAYLTLRLDHSEEEAKLILENLHNEAESQSTNYKELSQILEQKGIEIVKNNLIGYAFVHLKGMLSFFLDTARHDIYSFFVKDFEENEKGIMYHYKLEGIKGVFSYLHQFPLMFILYSFMIFLINIFLLISVIAFAFNKSISPEVKIITLLLIFFPALVTGPIGSSRFRVHVYPIILFTVPFFISYLKNSHFYKKFIWR